MTTTMTPRKTLPRVDARGLAQVEARDLAWIAEGADGIRDANLVLYRKGNRLALGEENEETRKTAILKVYTKSEKQQPRAPMSLHIPVEWDAIVLGESAVEKFCFPYYEAQRLLSRTKLAELKKEFYAHSEYVGLVHIPPSHPLLLRYDGDTVPFDIGGRVDEEPLMPE